VTGPEEALVFGTSPDCDVRVDNEYVSGHHARITRRRGAYYVEDLGSTNGTSIVRDGKRSQVTVPTRLLPGDEIWLSRVKIPWSPDV